MLTPPNGTNQCPWQVGLMSELTDGRDFDQPAWLSQLQIWDKMDPGCWRINGFKEKEKNAEVQEHADTGHIRAEASHWKGGKYDDGKQSAWGVGYLPRWLSSHSVPGSTIQTFQQTSGMLLERFLFGIIIRDGLCRGYNIPTDQSHGWLSGREMNHCRPGFRSVGGTARHS